MLRKSVTTVAVLLGASLAAGAAQAAMITFDFGGVVTSVQDPAGALRGGVHVNDMFSGTFTFDSTTPDLIPGDPTIGDYRSNNALVTLSAGDVAVSSASAANHWMIIVNDGLGLYDSFSMGSSKFDSNGMWVAELYVRATDWTKAALDSDILPLAAADLDGFTGKELSFVGQGGFNVAGQITTFTPEPATVAFVVLGSLIIFRRK